MIKLYSHGRKIGLSGATVSIIAAATILALLATISSPVHAASASPVGAVYIVDNNATANHVWVYPRYSNGQLGSTGTSFSTGGQGTGSNPASQGALALTSDGEWLLTVNPGSNQITVFKVQDEALVWKSITSSHGSDPISLTISKNLVYVLDASGSGNIAGFTLSNNGVLSFISGSVKPLSGLPNPSPEQIGFNPQGTILVVTEKATNNIDTYKIASNGVASAPKNQTSAGAGPYGFAFSQTGLLIVSEAASNS